MSCVQVIITYERIVAKKCPCIGCCFEVVDPSGLDCCDCSISDSVQKSLGSCDGVIFKEVKVVVSEE